MNIRTRRKLRGFVRSWTAHAGVYLAVLGYLQTQGEVLTELLGPSGTGLLMMLIGAAVVALRVKTKESLEDKGAR